MTLLFRRRCRLVVAAPIADDYKSISAEVTEITDLRVRFKITKDLGKHPNTAEVTVSNLSADRRAKVEVEGVKLLLHAGYGEALELLFHGDARTVDSMHKGTDWETVFKAGDGERATKHARVSESFAPNTTAADVVKRLGRALGLDGEIPARLTGGLTRRFVGGYVAHGSAAAELDRALKSVGYEWSVQDGVLEVREPGEASTEEAVVISPDHGLVDTVEVGSATKKGGKATIKGKCLLDAKIRPGRLLLLETERHGGRARVIKVTHEGDTHGTPWFSSWEAEAA